MGEEARAGNGEPQSLHRVAAVRAALGELTEITGPRRLQAVHWALCQIAHIQEPSAYFAAVHVLVGELMQARSFAIGLRSGGRVEFPYFVDEQETVPRPVAPGDRTLAGHVLRSREAVIATPETLSRLAAAGEIAPQEAPPACWLGVPLLRGSAALGLMVVKRYDRGRPFTQSDAEILAAVGEHVAATVERRLSAEALQESEARFRSLAETAPCGIVILRGEDVRFANSAIQQLAGRSAAALREAGFWDVLPPDFRESARRRAGECLAGRQAGCLEVPIVAPEGRRTWVELSFGLVRHEGRPALVVVAFDVTQRRLSEERVRFIAYHDPLTGLPNRLLFEDHLSLAIAAARRRGDRVALLYVDLDDFKQVNDGLGHEAGDELLRTAAERLRASVRDADTVARLGGDEFVIVLDGVRAPADAARVAAKLNEVLRAPVALGGRELVVTASIGIAVFPEDGRDAEALLRSADTALYRVKESGRDGCQLFTPAMQAAALARLDLESGLRRALERGELLLHYQPIVRLATGRVSGFEALLRWRHPSRGLIAPAEFLSAIEGSRLTMAVGEWALRTACAQARAWQALAGKELSVSVNLGARQFQQPELVQQVAGALRESGLDPGCLVLEITENHAMQNAEAAARTLRLLHELGVRVAVDDFGTGHSSLGDLRRLPLHCLKIDRSFVADIRTKEGDAAIARAIVALAHTLRLEVVAEGVETAGQARFLAAEGCDFAQGFLYGQPRDAAECTAVLGRRLPSAAAPRRPAAAVPPPSR